MTAAYHVPMGRAFDGALSPNPHYYEIKGRAAELARARGSQADVVLPEGQELDGPLQRAISDALPEGATFGFNLDDALAGLGHPTLGR